MMLKGISTYFLIVNVMRVLGDLDTISWLMAKECKTDLFCLFLFLFYSENQYLVEAWSTFIVLKYMYLDFFLIWLRERVLSLSGIMMNGNRHKQQIWNYE